MQATDEKEVLDFLEKITIKDFYLAIARSLKFVGKYAIELGQLQKDPIIMMTFRFPRPTLTIATSLGIKTVKEIETEKIGPLLKALVEFPPFTSDILDPLKTSPEEKIRYGEKTIAVAGKIEEILK